MIRTYEKETGRLFLFHKIQMLTCAFLLAFQVSLDLIEIHVHKGPISNVVNIKNTCRFQILTDNRYQLKCHPKSKKNYPINSISHNFQENHKMKPSKFSIRKRTKPPFWHWIENLLDSSTWSFACIPCAFESVQSKIEYQTQKLKSEQQNQAKNKIYQEKIK